MAAVPNVPPTAVNVVELPLQIFAPVMLVGAVDGLFIVTVTVVPPVDEEQGAVVFSIRTQ